MKVKCTFPKNKTTRVFAAHQLTHPAVFLQPLNEMRSCMSLRVRVHMYAYMFMIVSCVFMICNYYMISLSVILMYVNRFIGRSMMHRPHASRLTLPRLQSITSLHFVSSSNKPTQQFPSSLWQQQQQQCFPY